VGDKKKKVQTSEAVLPTNQKFPPKNSSKLPSDSWLWWFYNI